MDGEVVGEVVVHSNGSYKYVHRYLRGIHVGRGTIVRGLTGWETREEKDCIIPIKKFNVIDLTPSLVTIIEIPVFDGML